MTAAPKPPSVVHLSASAAAQTWCVVVIDDCADDRAEVRRLLLRGSDRRYHFVEAETGAAGVRAVLDADDLPDCVLLDYNLPDMDAVEVLAALAGPDGLTICPVVVLTGAVDHEQARATLRAGAQDYLGKGWMSRESLTHAVESAAERWQMSRELRDRNAELRETSQQLLLSLKVGHAAAFTWDIPTDEVRILHDGITASVDDKTAHPPGRFEAVLAKIHPDDRDAFRQGVREAIERPGTEYASEYRLVGPDASVQWIRDTGRVELDGDGHPLRLVGLATDITERKQAAEQLREADRRKDEFLAMLAHELRNPLAPIRAGLDVLERTVERTAATDRQLKMMQRQTTHLVRLVDDLMDVSRISQGKMDLKKERADLAALVEHAVADARPRIDAGRHRLEVVLPSQPLWIEADPIRITQVLCNLLDNAVKFMAPGGHIHLTLERRGVEAVARVRDQGMGIPVDMLPRVFELFTQLSHTRDRVQGGLGIGLALVQRLVQMHGGRVEAHSEGPGRGSELVLRLPLIATEAEAVQAPRPASPEPIPRSQRRVLVVDDNLDAADTLALLLEVIGFEAKAVHDGAAALECVTAFGPHVVLLDLGMVGMDGYETARRLRRTAAGRGLTLIALTGWGQDAQRRRTREAGFDHHLVKPVDIDRLQALLSLND